MFPQLPFGFQTNVRLYKGSSALQVGSLSITSFVGEVRNALSSMGLRDINSYTDLQLLRYADSLVGLDAVATQTYLSSVKQADSSLQINPIIANTLLSRLASLSSFVDLSPLSITTVGGLPSTSLWTPANITTQLWLDASDSATITLDAGAVSQWNDKSGNARHATQSVSASRPTVATAALNGLNGLNFDGANDFLETVGYIACNNPSSNTVVLAVSESSGTARRGIMGTRPAANPEGWFISYFDDRNRLIMFGSPSTAASDSLGTIRSPDINGFIKTATTIKLISFLNGASTTGTVTLTPVSTAESTKIGREQTSSPSESLLGKIYEIIEIPTTDTTIRQKAEGYLAHKWGLTANLPSDHPYKTNHPTV